MIGGRFAREIFRRRPVMCSVSIIHAASLLLLVLASFIQSWRTPREEVIEVQLFEIPTNWQQTPSPVASAPTPEPIPEPTPEPTPPEPTPEPTPNETPRSQPEPPPTPSWQPRSLEEIRSGGLRPATSQPSRPQTPAPTPATPTVSADDIAQRARRQVSSQNLTVNIPQATGQPTVSQTDANRYLGAILALFEREWQQPSTASVPSGQRQATMSLTIAGNGTIRQAQLNRPSGNPAMDQSVRSIFQRLRQLPPPRDYNINADPFQVNVVFELD